MSDGILFVFEIFVIAYTFVFAAASFAGGIELWRAFACAALISVAYIRPVPVLSEAVFSVSLVSAALLIVKKELSFGEFCTVSAGFVFVLLSAAGTVYFLERFTSVEAEWYGVAAGICAVSVSVMTSIVKKARSSKLIYDVLIADASGREHRFKGYLDTGNALYDNGEAVIVVSRKAAAKLGVTADGYMAVDTVSGIGVLPKTRLEYKIYYDKNRHKLYSTPALISDKMGKRGYDVLIHKDMKTNI